MGGGHRAQRVERVGVHVIGGRHLGVRDDVAGELAVEGEDRLELLHTAARVQANGVVGEADDDPPGRLQVVLAHAVVAEGMAVAVELEAVELDRDDVLAAGNLVVEPVAAAPDLHLALRLDAPGDVRCSRRRQHPAEERLLKEGVRRQQDIDAHRRAVSAPTASSRARTSAVSSSSTAKCWRSSSASS